MKLYSPQPIETINLVVESSPVWEVILGISGYTHVKMRHTFDLNEKWMIEKETMSETLIHYLDMIEETNFWFGLIMLQNKLSAASIRDFSNGLSVMSPENFYETLLPYHNRSTEPQRKMAAKNYKKTELFNQYAKIFNEHEFLEGYIRNLGKHTYRELCDLLTQTLFSWFEWISQKDEWKKWNKAIAYEVKLHQILDKQNPIEEIERITSGVKYHPESNIANVKLIPHVSYRPWVLQQRTFDTKLFFYPIKDAYLFEPGEPGSDLVRGHKALGDEVRLRLLYQLVNSSMSLQEISKQLKMSKTTLHHHLSLLKAAKFITVEKGIYSANMAQIKSFSGGILQFLGMEL